MAAHASLPERLVTELRAATDKAASTVRTEHASLNATLAKLDENEDGLPAETIRKRRDEARARSLDAMHKAGDVAAHSELVAVASDLLDMDYLVDTARFLAPISDPGAEAADIRRLAEAAERANYERILRRAGANIRQEVDRVVREAGNAPHQSPALAKLAALGDHVATLRGPQREEASAVLGVARARIEAAWTARAALLDAVKASAFAVDEVQTRADAVRGNRDAQARVSYFNFEHRRKQAA